MLQFVLQWMWGDTVVPLSLIPRQPCVATLCVLLPFTLETRGSYNVQSWGLEFGAAPLILKVLCDLDVRVVSYLLRVS